MYMFYGKMNNMSMVKFPEANAIKTNKLKGNCC